LQKSFFAKKLDHVAMLVLVDHVALLVL